MAPSNLQHRRAHNLLLISKLLNQRDGASPFTLILDSLEQSGRPLVAEYMRRARIGKVSVIYTSFETLRRPSNVDFFAEAWDQTTSGWQSEVAGYIKSSPNQKSLIVLDNLNSLSASESANLPAALSSLLGPRTSLVAVYHTDVPLSSCKSQLRNEYAPSPLALLNYMATTVLTTYAFPHVLARKAARERSLAEPSFGLEENIDGVIQGCGANADNGVVFEVDHRRKSGRGVHETYFLPTQPQSFTETAAMKAREPVILLEDHPLYRPQQVDSTGATDRGGVEDSTFELGLTDRQRQDREAVVLPYFDAQKGSGEGGRILYDMGEEDDFDEDEDEI